MFAEWFLTDYLWLTVPAYLVVQVFVLLRSSGPSRMAATLPLLVMIPVFVLTGIAYAQDSNLWPLWLLFASPVALLYVVIVALFQLAGKQGTGPRPAGR
jgi:hypothetical protein